MVEAGAEIGDEPEARARLRQEAAVDLVGDGRDQNVRLAEERGEVLTLQWPVVRIENRVEKLGHARLDRRRELSRDDDSGAVGHGAMSGAGGTLLL
jgi:hypothetical protein